MAQQTDAAQPTGVPDGATTLYEFEFGLDDLGSVRTAIANLASANGLADRARFNFILAVNELTTNAIRHGGGRGCVRLWRHGDELWCQIEDSGKGIAPQRLDRMREPRPSDRGHGLWLARHLCSGVSIETGRKGTRVLVRYPLAAAQFV